MKNIILSIIAVSAIACQSSQTHNDTTDKVETDTPLVAVGEKNCYSYTNNQDSILLTVVLASDSVSGQLTYNLFEKDHNQGIIKGKMYGDTLIADYIFNAEGTTSTREIAFLLNHHQALQGFGNVEERDGKTVFQDRKTLKFEKNMFLEKIECH